MRPAGLVGNESVRRYWKNTEDSVDTHETLVVTANGQSESNALLSPTGVGEVGVGLHCEGGSTYGLPALVEYSFIIDNDHVLFFDEVRD